MRESGLTDFQVSLAQLFFSLPESDGFLLAGGGALIAQGIVARPTEDLDFFTERSVGDIPAASGAFVREVEARGWTADLIRHGPDFRRWSVTGPQTVLVDLAVDSPATDAPSITLLGPAFAPSELVVRKTLALFGRAEPRDFVDVYALNQRYDRTETLRRAHATDAGFDLNVFALALRSHRRLDDGDFPNAGVSVADLREYFDAWASDIESLPR